MRRTFITLFTFASLMACVSDTPPEQLVSEPCPNWSGSPYLMFINIAKQAATASTLPNKYLDEQPGSKILASSSNEKEIAIEAGHSSEPIQIKWSEEEWQRSQSGSSLYAPFAFGKIFGFLKFDGTNFTSQTTSSCATDSQTLQIDTSSQVINGRTCSASGLIKVMLKPCDK